MDEFMSQNSGVRVREGHEDRDISVPGIAVAGVGLAVLGILTLVLARFLMAGFAKWADTHQTPLTPVQQQLRAERQPLETRVGRTPLPPTVTGIKPPPDWYSRAAMEDHLGRTFPAPRLQYDDIYDMAIFRDSEDAWLKSTGKGANGAIHIPIAQAIDLLSLRGLPAVSGPFLPANAAANVLAPELSGNAPKGARPQDRSR